MTLKENVASIFIIIKYLATIVYPPMVDTHHYEENETEKKLFSAFFYPFIVLLANGCFVPLGVK